MLKPLQRQGLVATLVDPLDRRGRLVALIGTGDAGSGTADLAGEARGGEAGLPTLDADQLRATLAALA